MAESPNQLLMGFEPLSANSSLSPPIHVGAGRVEIEAGVVFADEASYLCLPLSRLGIGNSESVVRIDSSCHCVRPTLVRYFDSRRQPIDGVRIDFVPEGIPDEGNAPTSNTIRASNTERSEYQPSELSVELTFVLSEGGSRVVVIHFLQTLADNQLSSSIIPENSLSTASDNIPLIDRR